MKNYLTFSILAAALLLAGCSASKKAGAAKDVKNPAGTWEALVSGTPMGDIPLEMVLAKEGETYTGYVMASGQRMNLDNLKVEGNTITSSFFAAAYGTDVTVQANYNPETDTIEGWVLDSYKLSGKRKMEK